MAIGDGTDDVEVEPGQFILNSNDVDFHQDTYIGLRFHICIDQGATILDASLIFTADEADTAATSATIWGELSEDAGEFPAADPTTRTRTASSVDWIDIQPWEVGTVDASPDLSSIVTEIITDTPWTGCGHMVFLIQGTGDREAVSYDNDPDLAPRLVVTFQP